MARKHSFNKFNKLLFSVSLTLMIIVGLAAPTKVKAEGTNNDKLKVISVDAGRKYFSVDSLKRIIDRAKDNDFNALQLLLGNDCLRFILDDMTVEANGTSYDSEQIKTAIKNANKKYMDARNGQADPNAEGVLTEKDMKEILDYAKAKGISIIPVINSPGHMNTILSVISDLGMERPNFVMGVVSPTTMDLRKTEAVEFTKALIGKYIDYFKGKVEYFNFGADEYATSTTKKLGYGWFILQQRLKVYDKFVNYVNDLAAKIKAAGMKPMCFNDGIYYRELDSFGEFDKDIIISLWTAGWEGYYPASAQYLASKGHKLLNTNDSWYYVLGREPRGSGVYDFQSALHGIKTKKFDDTVSSKKIDIIGSVLAIWCDEPAERYMEAAAFRLMDEFALNNPEYFKRKIQETVPPVDPKAIKSVSVDVGRKEFTTDQVKKIIDRASAKGYTHLHLLLGNDGLRFLLDDMSINVDGTEYTSQQVQEAIKAGNRKYAEAKKTSYGKEYSQKDMDDLLEYARNKKIELIPAVNSPGHMDTILNAMEILGIAQANFAYKHYNGKTTISATTVDLKNEKAIKFTKELIKKYVKYFAAKKVEIFNFGADEYGNDAVVEPSWFTLQKITKTYDLYVKYVNDMAEIVLNEGLKPMCFNDGIYYDYNSFPHEFNKKIIIALWTGGYGGLKTANANLFVEKGHEIFNFNEAWYYVIGNNTEKDIYNFIDAERKTREVGFTEVNASVSKYIKSIGSSIAVWADNPSKEYEEDKLFKLIDNFADSNPDHFVVAADYTKLDQLLQTLPKDYDNYTAESVARLKAEINQVNRNLTKKEQGIVDGYIEKIKKAFAALELKAADYSAVDAAIKQIPADLSKYTPETAAKVTEALNAVIRNKKIDEQAVVDGYAQALEYAIAGLKLKNINYKMLEKTDPIQGEEAVFRSEADFSKFRKVLVDNVELKRDIDYTAKSGSTVIVLSKDFTKNLKVGSHTITIVSADGTSTADFKVQPKVIINTNKEKKELAAKKAKNIKTGDNSNILGLSLLGLLSLVTTLRLRKRFN